MDSSPSAPASRAPASAADERRRTLGSGRGRRWDEDSIRAALTELLAERDVWPTCDEFEAMGAKHLREIIGRGRGAAWWASEMGLPGGDRPRGGARRWSEQRIRETLAEFLAGRDVWPSWAEFDAAGLHAFREALRHYGGPERWAAEMGVTLAAPARPFRTPRPRPPSTSTAAWPRWNDQRIHSELDAFLAGRSDWPPYGEFVASGHKRLYAAVRLHGGARAWAARMGVRWVERPGGRRLWSEERIEAELATLLVGHATWPRGREFEAAGKLALLAAVRRHGGVERWAKRLHVGLPPAARNGRGHSADAAGAGRPGRAL